ncbi:unnamed protein product [Closterium sp. NIES-53]
MSTALHLSVNACIPPRPFPYQGDATPSEAVLTYADVFKKKEALKCEMRLRKREVVPKDLPLTFACFPLSLFSPPTKGDATPDAAVRTYADVIKEEALKREKEETLRQIAKKKAEEAERKAAELSSAPTKAQGAAAAPAAPPAAPAAAAAAGVAPGGAAAAGSKRRNRWDVAGGGGAGAAEAEAK